MITSNKIITSLSTIFLLLQISLSHWSVSCATAEYCQVHDLTSDSLKNLTNDKKEKAILIFHYSDNCTHCQQPKDFINKFSYDSNKLKIYKSQDTGLVTQATKLPSSGFPTFYLLKKNSDRAIEYVGSNSPKELQKWLDEKLK